MKQRCIQTNDTTMMPRNITACHTKMNFLLIALLLINTTLTLARETSTRSHLNMDEFGTDLEPHPDPNHENYPGMIYVGRMHDDDETRIGFENDDNGIKYIFGTGFDETHKLIEEKDLEHGHVGADVMHDVADRTRGNGKTREQVLKEMRHGKIDPKRGPKPFGHVGTYRMCTCNVFLSLKFMSGDLLDLH